MKENWNLQSTWHTWPGKSRMCAIVEPTCAANIATAIALAVNDKVSMIQIREGSCSKRGSAGNDGERKE
jgi:hypothetical protein